MDTAEAVQLNGSLHFRGKYSYGSLPGYNFSTLKELARSPLHYKYRLENQREQTASLELGSAGHIAILEPERFLREFVLWNARDEEGKVRQRRGKKWDAFCAENAGKTVIRDEEYDLAIALKDAVRADENAMRYLGAGRPEVALSWTDAETGLPCKGRTDWIHPQHAVVDVKGARDVGARGFGNACARYGYHIQQAFYCDGYERATGVFPKSVIVAVEMHPPHDVVTYVLPTELLDIGRDEYRNWLVRVRECGERREWLGQGGGIEQTLQLPAWALPDEEDDLAALGLEL